VKEQLKTLFEDSRSKELIKLALEDVKKNGQQMSPEDLTSMFSNRDGIYKFMTNIRNFYLPDP
jgi:uncharacterized protein YdgA (DUF945 family)